MYILTAHNNILFTAEGFLLESEGAFRKHWPKELGKYIKDSTSNGKPTYRHVSGKCFLHYTPNSYWMVRINS